VSFAGLYKLGFVYFTALPDNFFKSARSDVKIRQNTPFSIGQIRKKYARNLELFVPFFTPWG
jgi:hypothetical protein